MLKEHKDVVRALAFSSDHSYLASASSDGDLIIWDINNKYTLKKRLENGGYCFALIQLPNGEFASGSNSNINIWSPLKSEMPLITLAGHKGFIWSLALSPNKSLLASGSSDETIKVWSYTSNQKKAIITLIGHFERVFSLVFISNETLASGSYDNRIKIWNLNSGK